MSNIKNTDLTKKITLSPSTIETIDIALYNYVDNLNLFCTTNNGWSKTPIIWSSSERSFQIKDNKNLRDINGSLIPPIISIERINVVKDPSKKGSFQANVSPSNDRYIISKLLNQEKTSNFAIADTKKSVNQINFITSKKNKKIVYQSISAPIPIYVTVEYKINILTNFLTQMNELVQPFMARTAQNYFIIHHDNYRYESFMDQTFTQENKSGLAEEERSFKTTINIKVLGYLIGEGNNQEKPQLIISENAVEVRIPREEIVTDPDKDT